MFSRIKIFLRAKVSDKTSTSCQENATTSSSAPHFYSVNEVTLTEVY